jgi:hypothetical protein
VTAASVAAIYVAATPFVPTPGSADPEDAHIAFAAAVFPLRGCCSSLVYYSLVAAPVVICY